MIESQELIETEPVTEAEPQEAPQKQSLPRQAPWWKWPELRRRLRHPAVPRVALGMFLTTLLFLTVEYLHLAHLADRRLAEGPFATSTDILSAPEMVAPGDALTPEALVARLERSGYNRTPGNPAGWYAVQGRAVQVMPGGAPQDPVRIAFDQGRVLNIVSLGDNTVHQQYQLAPQLLTNLSGAREKRRLVRYSDIPPSLIQAVTSVEDKHFFQHHGFDYGRMLKAAWVDFRDGRKQQGASTLTMQLARALWLDPAKSWRRKVEEILITMHLEHRLTKQQIFEDYANQIYFGRRGAYSINGFGEAAWVYFGKELWQIDPAEAALLAGLVQRPSYYNPFRYPERAMNRRNLVLALMRRNGQLSPEDYQAAVASPLKLAQPMVDESENSYFISMMNDELQSTLGESAKEGRSVVTTLDPGLQRAAEAAARSGMEAVDQQLHLGNAAAVRPQVALIALNPHTGEIKALVGGRNYGDSQLNHVLAMRQPGSVFKPFVYAAAIDSAVEGGSRTFTPATLVSDEATTFSFNGIAYQPKDYGGDYQGDVTLRTALAMSLNVATVSLAEEVGYRRVVAIARRAGLNGNIKPTPSVALGTYETTPLEIAAAYTIFANQGTWVKPTTIETIRSADGALLGGHQPETRPALDPRVAYITANLMQEVLRSGTGAAARSHGFYQPAAGKTGTSHDGWFAGFTSELLCVVWVGFDDDRQLNLEGAKSALPIWADFMKRAAQMHPYSGAHEFRAPNGIVTADICDTSGELAGPYCPNVHSEVFIAGTEPASACGTHARLSSADGGDSRNR